MDSVQTKFKQCPFCKEEDNADVFPDSDSDSIMGRQCEYFVECESCGANGPLCATEQEATIAWNSWK